MNRTRAVLPVLLAAFVLAVVPLPSAHAQVPLSPTKIPQFVQPLDLLDLAGVTGLPVALGTPIDVSLCEFQTNILPRGTLNKKDPNPPATWVWGYQLGSTCAPGLQPHSYIGPVVVAARGTPTEMTFWNKLPNADVAKVKAYARSTDQTLIWGDPLSLDSATGSSQLSGTAIWDGGPPNPEANECWAAAQLGAPIPAECNNNYGFSPATLGTYNAPVPAAVHLHGGEVPGVLDGGPDSWWTKNGIYGHGYYSRGGFTDAAAGKAVYRFPNGQEAAPTWFHDHMLGATRLNVYAGIAGAYYQIDGAMPLAPGLHPLGLSDPALGTDPFSDTSLLLVPIVIQDRMFDTNGQLFFPNVGINPEHPFWIPEFVGDVIVVNGKAWPFFNVQPKRYRFLFLNGSNARAYEMFLMSKTTQMKGPSLWVIGNDQGYLDKPQKIDPNAMPPAKRVLAMMPGERYEVIIDFSSVAGQVIEIQNVARTPYTAGAPVNGATTGRIIRFNVAAATPGFVDNTFDPAAPGAVVRLDPMVRLTNELGTTPAAGVTIHKTRRLTVNEVVGPGGPLEVLVNNTLYEGSKPRPYGDFTPVPTQWNTSYYSELPHEGETELWEIVNITADAHPMHPHLVAFQVLNRQPLDVKAYTAAYNALYANTGMVIDGNGPPLDYNCGLGAPGRGVISPATCVFGGNPDPVAVGAAVAGTEVPPMPQEVGWKDTVQVLPNMITRFLVRFAKTDAAADAAADGLGYDFIPSDGHGYVWHCHIVDHEDNEMMRPYTVWENPGFDHTYLKGVDY